MPKGKAEGKEDRRRAATVPSEIAPETDASPLLTGSGRFDLDDPDLPGWVRDGALRSGGYPYDEVIREKLYDGEIEELQVELVKLQKWIGEQGRRLVLVFEGRDAAGKGSSIGVIRRYLNPRSARLVALPRPNETERGQWYFQRYVRELPTAGEIVAFDRSWYNRAGVEPVMGFCTPEQRRSFLRQAPIFERLLVEDGIVLFKFWLEIGREMQLKEFHERRHDPLKVWKLSPIDYAAMERWDDYTRARDKMLGATHSRHAPWTVVLMNDKKRGRINIIRHILARFIYDGRDADIVREVDARILGGPDLFHVGG